MVLKHLTDIPTALIATAADDRAGAVEAMEQELFIRRKTWRGRKRNGGLCSRMLQRAKKTRPFANNYHFLQLKTTTTRQIC